MNYETLLVERHDAIEILTLNRPASLNALSEKMVSELRDYVFSLRGRPDARVVVLRGEGRAFCAGLDIKDAGIATGETRLQRAWRIQLALGDVLRAMRSLPQPFIALGQGAACGGGFSLMLAADVRFGAPTLKMNAAYIKIGLGGADMGSSYFLPRLVGASLAAELLLTGRFLHADRALRTGLLSDVVDEDRLLDTGLALAGEMVANAPMGLALTKQALNINIDASSIDAAFALEDRQQVMMSESEDYREAMTAFTERRAPAYTGR